MNQLYMHFKRKYDEWYDFADKDTIILNRFIFAVYVPIICLIIGVWVAPSIKGSLRISFDNPWLFGVSIGCISFLCSGILSYCVVEFQCIKRKIGQIFNHIIYDYELNFGTVFILMSLIGSSVIFTLVMMFLALFTNPNDALQWEQVINTNLLK